MSILNLWSMLATDVEFGNDGKLYLADWVSGWNGAGKGRIYTLTDRHFANSSAVGETTDLFREGFSKRTPLRIQA